MDLTTLGWNYQLRQRFREYEPHGLIPARVAHSERQTHLVLGPDQRDATDAWMAAVSERFGREARSQSEHPVVGDWVAIRPRGGGRREATIHAVLPSRSRITHEGRVLAANLDVLFMVASLDGEPDLRALERYLALAWDSGANPVVVLAEADRCPDVAVRAAVVGDVCPGVSVHPVSARTGEGLDGLRAHLPRGWTGALLSASAPVAACSLLLDALCPQAPDGDGRSDPAFSGRRDLRILPDAGLLIDTPALRDLQLVRDAGDPLDAEGSDHRFDDIEALAARCRFRDCTHQHEPACAVREAIETGALDPDRLRSYRKLFRPPPPQDHRADQRVRRDEHERGRQVSKWSKRSAPPER